MTGSEYVTIMSPIQNVRAHIPMQIPRTRVGKISAHRMLGTGPKPVTKQQKYTITLPVEMAACNIVPKLMTFPRTNKMSVANRTGRVDSSSHLVEIIYERYE